MLKKIKVEHVVCGMFIRELCGSWMEHPFWRTRFLLDDAKDLATLRESSIREVWIDTTRGRDVEGAEAVMTPAERDAEVQAALESVPDAGRDREPASTREELERAATICRKSRQAMTSIFGEARMGRAVDTELARKVVEEITDSVTRNSRALVSLARLKNADDYTYMHSVAVCALMVALGRELGLEDDAVLAAGEAGLMHDIGKAAMPLEVLNKPGKLTPEEFVVMKRHPAEGRRILQAAEEDLHPVTLDVCLHHHEKMDGSGYPEGLAGDQITLYAKMGAVCDVYDAITSNRPYKAGWDPGESIRRMAEWADGHFDPMVFQAFVKSLGIYPVGSLVRLESGRIGVVVDQSSGSLLKPVVKIFYSTSSGCRIPPKVVDLSAPHVQEVIAGREDPTAWPFPDLDELWSGLPGGNG
ncbi:MULTISPECIES: HD-GYP domain-containing protein [unclassified Thioalkalivibrio]|uniref:HD-GYP domain-containing protein n=1 Tax=unclassified Thioalkalivibrio TaxID=2621013 RepID=UPI00036C515A|nr:MULTISPECIES: HD-GYP domain-containing protein [unclassified Thioalkalivibrio]